MNISIQNIIIGISILSVVPCSNEACADDADLTRFKSEFKEAVAKNEEFFGSVFGSAIFSENYYSIPTDEEIRAYQSSPGKFPANQDANGGIVIDLHKIEFAIDGPLMRRTVHPMITKEIVRKPALIIRDRHPGFFENAICVGRDSSFRIDWPSQGAQPILKGLDRKKESYANQIRSEFRFYLALAIRPLGVSQEKLDPRSGLLVKKMTSVSSNKEKLLRVEFEIAYNDAELPKVSKSNATRSGWFITKPDDHWVIQEASLSTSNVKDAFYVKTEFGDKQDGIPLPKKVIWASHFWWKGMEFESIRHGSSPENSFALPAFGLPDIDQPLRSSNRLQNAQLLMLLGIVGLIGAMVLKIAGGRLRDKASHEDVK
jgi:hypothetical protein